MIEVGRIVVKLAGRDAGKKAVIVDILDEKFVLIDGETRRRKCNVLHLEPIEQVIEINKGASHEEVSKAFEKLGLKPWNTKPKDKKEKPKKLRLKRKKSKEDTKPKKKKASTGKKAEVKPGSKKVEKAELKK